MFPGRDPQPRSRADTRLKPARFTRPSPPSVPIVPICVSTTSGNINLNHWNNGHVIVEMLAPVDTSKYGKENVRKLAAHCRRADGRKSLIGPPKSPSATPPKNKSTSFKEYVFNWRSAPLTPERLLILIGGRLGYTQFQLLLFMEKICHSVDVGFIQVSGLARARTPCHWGAKAGGTQTHYPSPLLESRRGQPLFLTLQRAHRAFMDSRKAAVWGINGMVFGADGAGLQRRRRQADLQQPPAGSRWR